MSEMVPQVQAALTQEAVDRARRIEAKMTNFMHFFGLSHLNNGKVQDRSVVVKDDTIHVSSPAASFGEVWQVLEEQECHGTFPVIVCGNYWGEVSV